MKTKTPWLAVWLAFAAAAKEDKLVFIDFYTTWCGPCKLLDAQTWTDAAVGKLINEKAVALKLDAEKEGRAVAERYKVAAYPTLLLLKADGTVVDRIVGFREPASFIPEFKDALAGKSSLARAMAAVTASSGPEITRDAVEARYQLAQAQAREGNTRAALEGFLWCFDEGMIAVPSYGGVRLSFLLGEIDRLGTREPAARAALVARAEGAEQRMLADAGDRRAAADFAALTATLKQPDRMVAAFDMLPPGDARRAGMGHRLYLHFIELQRYPDALQVVGYDRMRSQFAQYQSLLDRPNLSAQVQDANRRLVITNALNAGEALAGAGRLDEAREMQAKLVAFDHDAATRNELKKRLKRAGHPELAESK